MSTRFYEADPQYPEVVRAIMLTVRDYFVTKLYPDIALKDIDEARKRFVRAQIQAGSDPAFRMNIDSGFFKTNLELPFTAYALGSQDYDDTKPTYYASSSLYFSSFFGARVAALPMVLEVPLISFFNKSIDYLRAQTILQFDKSTLTRLDVPIMVNGKKTRMPITLDQDIQLGAYTFQFEEWLRTEQINDVAHPIKIKYLELQTSADIWPVDDFGINYYELGKSLGDSIHLGHIDLPHQPKVLSIDPSNGQLVPIDSKIVITFSKPMVASSVEDAFGLEPYVDVRFKWNDEGSQVTIEPFELLKPNTEYQITILGTAEDGDRQTISLEEAEETIETIKFPNSQVVVQTETDRVTSVFKTLS